MISKDDSPFDNMPPLLMRFDFLESLEAQERVDLTAEEATATTHIIHRSLCEARGLLVSGNLTQESLRQRLLVAQHDKKASRATETIRAQRERENEVELLVTIAALREKLNASEKQHQLQLLQMQCDHSKQLDHLQSFFAEQLDAERRRGTPSASRSPSLSCSEEIVRSDNFVAYFSAKINPHPGGQWRRCRGEISQQTLVLRFSASDEHTFPLYCIGALSFEGAGGSPFFLTFSCLGSCVQCSFGTREERARCAHRMRSLAPHKPVHVDVKPLLERRKEALRISQTASAMRRQINLTPTASKLCNNEPPVNTVQILDNI